MDIKAYQQWVSDLYKELNWYQYHAFIRSNFLTEEVGELCQAIRKYEIGRDRPDEEEQMRAENLNDIKEELGDVLGNLFIIAHRYNLSFEEIITAHKMKLEKRFAK